MDRLLFLFYLYIWLLLANSISQFILASVCYVKVPYFIKQNCAINHLVLLFSTLEKKSCNCLFIKIKSQLDAQFVKQISIELLWLKVFPSHSTVVIYQG